MPQIYAADLENIHDLIENRRPLAYCLAFVAGRFIPGLDSYREQLGPYIIQFMKEITSPKEMSEEENWTHLQALSVLYAYVQIPKSGPRVSMPNEEYLGHWTLKSTVENFALQLSLHRSIENVKLLLQNGCPDIAAKNCYRNSLYWLWLFTLSHHHSIITRTPPSIRLDSTISGSVEILKKLHTDTSTLRILAEVDLCILWSQLASVEKGLGEWWCPPPDTREAKEILAVLEKSDAALRVWAEKWTRLHNEEQAQSVFDSAYPDSLATKFHSHVTRFCISTFATLISHDHSAITSAETFAAIMKAVLKSADAARDCCDFLLDLEPLQKEGLRYSPDFTFTIVSFCCLHIIHAHTLLSSTHPILNGHIEKVKQVAYLMVDSSVGQNRCPRLYGESILLRLQTSGVNQSSRDSVPDGSIRPLSPGSSRGPISGHSPTLGPFLHTEQVWSGRYHEAELLLGPSSLSDAFNAGHNLFDDYEVDYSFILDPSLGYVTQ